MTIQTIQSAGALHRLSLKPSKLVTALEEDTTGAVGIEREYVIYGILKNPEKLKEAKDVIKQRQSALKLQNGQVRIREATEDGVVQYILTAKSFIKDGGRKEVSTLTSKDLYDVFRDITGESMDKIRYTFPAGVKQTNAKGEEVELLWEVDVFQSIDGKDQPWIKIDLEYYQDLDALPGLPVILEEMIFSKTGNYSEEEKAKIAELYSTMFTNKF